MRIPIAAGKKAGLMGPGHQDRLAAVEALANSAHTTATDAQATASGKAAVGSTTPAALAATASAGSSSAAARADHVHQRPLESICIAIGDEVTPITTGTAKVTIHLPYAFTLYSVFAELSAVQTSGPVITFDINEAGVSVLSTKLTIDNGEEHSGTAATPAVISDANLAQYAKVTIDVDQIGDGTAKGAKIWLVGRQSA